jgi:hypothetical protein
MAAMTGGEEAVAMSRRALAAMGMAVWSTSIRSERCRLPRGQARGVGPSTLPRARCCLNVGCAWGRERRSSEVCQQAWGLLTAAFTSTEGSAPRHIGVSAQLLYEFGPSHLYGPRTDPVELVCEQSDPGIDSSQPKIDVLCVILLTPL